MKKIIGTLISAIIVAVIASYIKVKFFGGSKDSSEPKTETSAKD